MARPFDISKFRKTLTKSIDGLSVGFNDPKTWISTGNYALNYLISGDFTKGVPLGKVTMFAGESGCLPEYAKVFIKGDHDNVSLVTVGVLKELFHTGQEILIQTPDGFQKITAWFDKGELPLVKVVTESGLETVCAENHLLQYSDGQWAAAAIVQEGDYVITVSDEKDKVVSVKPAGSAECYDFTVDHENHRYWGDGFSSHNSGKSYICSGNLVRHAQEQGIFVVLIDSENALDESWLHALGVDTSEDKLLKLNMAMIDDVAKTVSEFMKEYKALPPEDRTKVLFIIDSVGMLLSPTDTDQFNRGELKGDMGRKPKALNALVRNCVNMFGEYEVGLVCTNHTYASQDPYSPDPNISGGSGFVYASSIVVAMKKLKLKEDEDGNKISEVRGIRSGCKIMKTRYSKPFEDIEVQIPYDSGMSPYSGLFTLLDKKGVIKKEGISYVYTCKDGSIIKKRKKEWNRNDDGCMDRVILEWDYTKEKVDPVEIEFEIDELTGEITNLEDE